MSLSPLQLAICRVLAPLRREDGESYFAGGSTLDFATDSPRRSRVLDLFHDSEEALARSVERDEAALRAAGFAVEVRRRGPSHVTARVTRPSSPDPSTASSSTDLEWSHDSAYRFFPLVESEEFGLALHPFDLATNKTLALVGRLEPRDWIDMIHANERIQPLGYLAWAACGKDPGFSPSSILEESKRATRYAREEIEALDFDGPPPDAGDLSRRWKEIVREAERVVAALPAPEAGKCVVDASTGGLLRAPAERLPQLLADRAISFHPGRLRGAWPRFVSS